MPPRLAPSMRSLPRPQFLLRRPIARFESSKPHSEFEPVKSPQTTLSRVLLRMPSPLRPYVSRLLNSPTSHIISFLILHEITAVLPIIGLGTLFHFNVVPLPHGLTEEGAVGRYIEGGMERYGRYFERKGWFGFGQQSVPDEAVGHDGKAELAKAEVARTAGERSTRILMEVATAYAITKVLLPLRVLGCVWATPWFARVVVGPAGRVLKKFKARGSGKGKVDRRSIGGL